MTATANGKAPHKTKSSESYLRDLLKQAVAMTEDTEASMSGSSTHPSADAEDNTQNATEGFRSNENTSDVKKQEPEKSPEVVAEVSPGDDQPTDGQNAKATGEDPTAEDAYKETFQDPGTSSVADVGGKQASLLDCARTLEKAGSALLAAIEKEASAGSDPKQASQAAADKKPASAKPEKTAAEKEAEAGAEVADVADGETEEEQLRKVAAAVGEAYKSIVRDATERALLVHAYVKSAEEEGEEDEGEDDEDGDSESSESDSGGAGESAAPPAAIGGGDMGGGGGDVGGALSGLSPQDLAMLLQALQGGGAPADAGLGGAPVDTGMGGAEGGVAPDDLAALDAALSEAGTQPREVLAMVLADRNKTASEVKVDPKRKQAYLSIIKEIASRNRK